MDTFTATSEKLTRYILGILLLLVAMNAFAGGVYGMAGAKGIPLDWLEHSVFKSYFIPALILFIVVGGCCLAASVAVLKNLYWAPFAALGCCLILIIWILAQVSIIGYIGSVQTITAATTIITLFFALLYFEMQVAYNNSIRHMQLSL